MTVESASYISDLNSSYPAATDAKSEGDDHLRLIKSAVKATFPNVTGAVTPTHTELNYVDGVTSAIQTQLDAKAPLASPAFTGTPTAPTASTGTGTTQLATTAFVGNAILASSGITATLPGQGGNSGKFLTTDGSTASWGSAGDVTLTGTQTLTNKTIEAGTFTNGYTEETYTANSGTGITLDLANGSFQIITLTGSPTITMPTAVAGKSFILLLKSGSGSYTVTWSTVAWPGGTAPTLTSTASKMDILSFFSDGSKWYGTTVGLNYTP